MQKQAFEDLDELARGRLFLTVAEFADLFRADPRTVRRGIERGEIAAVKVSGLTRIPVPEVRRMLGESFAEPAVDAP